MSLDNFVSRSFLSDTVAEELRQLILSGTFSKGDKLASEPELTSFNLRQIFWLLSVCIRAICERHSMNIRVI